MDKIPGFSSGFSPGFPNSIFHILEFYHRGVEISGILNLFLLLSPFSTLLLLLPVIAIANATLGADTDTGYCRY